MINSPLPIKNCQFLLPEDQLNLNQITVANEVTNSIEMEPMIEPLDEVYSVAFLRNTENGRFSRRRSTLLTVLDSQGSSRRDSRSSDFWSFGKRRSSKSCNKGLNVKQVSIEENRIEEVTEADIKKLNGCKDKLHSQPSKCAYKLY